MAIDNPDRIGFRNPGFIFRCADCDQMVLDGVLKPHKFISAEDPYVDINPMCLGDKKTPRRLRVIRILKSDLVYMVKLRHKDHYGTELDVDADKIHAKVIYENNSTAPLFVENSDGAEELSIEIEETTQEKKDQR